MDDSQSKMDKMSVVSVSIATPDQSALDIELSKTPDKQDKDRERKAIPIDMKLENRLNIKDMERLQDAFMAEGDGYDNKLSLNKDQFCEALTILLNKGAKGEYGELFDKVDVTREGIVDWDKFASHMLLEFYERDDRVKSTQVPQWKDLKNLPSPHKDVIQKVSFLKNTNRYLSISKEGCISMWGTDLKLQRAMKTSTESCKARDLWVTHFVVLQNVNKIALAFTSKEIAIYDLSSKLEFNTQYRITGLLHSALHMDYWANPNNPNESILVWGDVGGFVNAVFFASANIALFERPPAPAGEKQEPCLNVHLEDVKHKKFKNAVYTKYEAHEKEWVRQVSYSHYLECFISCATSYESSMVIGWMERHSALNQNLKSVFSVTQGINAFDYNSHLNLIATAGVNHHVCLWNPYVVSKPNGVLRGHMASVIQVQFIKSRGQLISFSKDKVLRIWDVQLQVCIQRLAGMFPKGPEVHSTLYFDESKARTGQDRNRLFITFNYQLTVMDMKVEIKDRIMSHEKPVVAALYNSVYNQAVSVCQSGTVIVWMIDTGQKVKQFSNIHGHSEVTCIAQDQSQTRLFTGSTDGTVKFWDFNGHCYHTMECAAGQPADVGQILNLKRSVVVVGWAKHITVFRTAEFRDFHVQPSDWKGGQGHGEDILAVAFSAPNQLASGSYDGEIVVWNTNSEQASRHLNQRSRRKQMKSRSKTFVTSREVTFVSGDGTVSKSRPKSKASRNSSKSPDDQNEFSSAVAKLLFLEARKGNSAGGGANLVSCGGNGWVRFWNTSHKSLLAEFVAHHHAGSIIMAIDKKNQFLVTGDVDGLIKVWNIVEYCVHAVEEVVTDPPPMMSQFHPHSDMINTLELCERNERTIIISASSDCSVAVWDVYGNKIGIFGQEEHWKIEPYVPGEEEVEEEEEREKEVEVEKEIKIEPDLESEWEPDDRAVDDPIGYRVNSWDQTFLGKDYQELRVKKRERRQPGLIEDLPYLHWERTGAAPTGPYSALETKDLEDVHALVKPDADKYFMKRSQSAEMSHKQPALSDTLKTAFDEKTLFPKYILDFETKMKQYHQVTIKQEGQNKVKMKTNLQSLQNIGLKLGEQTPKSPTRKGILGKLRGQAPSRLSSLTGES